MRIIHIPRRMDPPPAHSGYDQLTRFMGATPYPPGRLFRHLRSAPPGALSFVKGLDPEWYDLDHFCLEMDLWLQLQFSGDSLVHVLNGERQFRYLGDYRLRRSNRLFVTFHQPPPLLRRALYRPEKVRKADTVIVLGSSQKEFCRELTGRDNVHVVPLGVDTSFFTPARSAPAEVPLRCLTVGGWLRDVETLRKVVTILSQIRNCQIEFHVVTSEWCRELYHDLPSVNTHHGLSEEELRALYRQSHLLLLPLNDCAGCNSLLEAMACGLPVFTSDVGSIRDYAGESNAVLAPFQDPDILVDALLKARQDRAWLARMGQASRRRAEAFSWKKIAHRMGTLYRDHA